MISRVAVLPYPPLLVPELTVRSRAEIERLRDACLHAVSSLTQASTRWVAIGADRCGTDRVGPETVGTFAGYGVDVSVALARTRPRATPDPLLPLPALVAGWLREQASADQVTVHLLAPDKAPADCRHYGASLERALREESVALLVLAEGTNCRNDQSPFAPDSRAEQVDELIRSALAGSDIRGLQDLDPNSLSAVGVYARPALEAMAAAVESAGGVWTAELLYSDTPFGITYHVAVWSPRSES